MARTFRRKDPLRSMSEINVTSLLDLSFCLLIIFMISTPLIENPNKEQKMGLTLPKQSAMPSPKPTQEAFRTISLNSQGELFWQDKKVTEAQLKEAIAKASKESPTPIINVRADAGLPYQKIVSVLDWVKQNNLHQISLNTQSP